jgi:hypothetical protein
VWDPVDELMFYGFAVVFLGGGIAVFGAWVERKPGRLAWIDRLWTR